MDKQTQQDARIAKISFASVYPHYLHKIQKKGRTKAELHQILFWLTGYDDARLEEMITEGVSFQTFFQKSSYNTNAHKIRGVICVIRIEEIQNPLTRQVRCLDKLIDELAKGRTVEKILHPERR